MSKLPYSRAYVEITNICNRSCSFCPGTKRELRSMTREEFGIVTDKLKPLTKYIYFHVMGEPLTHRELPLLISDASSKGFNCAVTTNGTLLPKRGKEIVEAGVYKVNISVHSFEDGSLEDYLDYIKGCLNFADYASQKCVLTVLRLWNKGYDKDRNLDTVALMKKKFPEEWHYGPRGARIRDKLHLEYGDRFEWPDMEAENFGDSVFCYGLKDHFGILSDGSIIPCCLDHEGDIRLGNAFTDDITAILSCERAEKMKNGFSQRKATEELCRRCGYARRFG